MKIIIVGGVAGGATAAARLRRLDERAEIIMVEKGEYISFANCGLPYYIGGEIKEKSALTLQTPTSFNKRFNVDVRINSKVTAIDRVNKSVTIETNNGSYIESYDKLVLSMGAEPIKPPIKGIDSSRVFTLRNITDSSRIKEHIRQSGAKTAAIVGGGYIGVEMAENLTAAGLKVTLLEMSNQVIAPLDYDMACDVHNYMRGKGVDLRLSSGLKSLSDTEQGLNLVLTDGSRVDVDMAVLAIGVKPDNALAKQSGLECGERGGIVVDEHMLTSDCNIYAVGDVVEVVDFVSRAKTMIPLASPANKQGRIAADNICGFNSTYGGTQGSAILKVFDMAVATTGINEKTAQKLGLTYEKSFTYSGSHAGYYPGASNMSIKIVFDIVSGRILGAQIVGFDGVDKRCDVLATAIRANMTASDLTKLELCYAPPFSSAKDPVNMAGYVIENIISGKVKIFHWHDVAKVKDNSNACLLDTRTELEYYSGHIDGFINIPLDSLRKRLEEIDKTKTIYVHCQSGLRSYLACRILSQNGYDCYNLSGGYRLYNSIFKKVKS